jgi:hypothetical protein
MKALTVWQPWATAIVVGVKQIENRVWRPPDDVVTRRIAIHAGKKAHTSKGARSAIAMLPVDLERPLGGIVGTVVVDFHLPYVEGRVAGLAMAMAKKYAKDPFFMGPFGWVLAWPARVPFHPCRGYQGLWNADAEGFDDPTST